AAASKIHKSLRGCFNLFGSPAWRQDASLRNVNINSVGREAKRATHSATEGKLAVMTIKIATTHAQTSGSRFDVEQLIARGAAGTVESRPGHGANRLQFAQQLRQFVRCKVSGEVQHGLEFGRHVEHGAPIFCRSMNSSRSRRSTKNGLLTPS